MALPLFSGAQDPSQLENLINQVITYLNNGFSGATPQTVPVVAGTTSANLPANGTVTLSSTVASAIYTLTAPVRGQTVALVTVSTKSQTVRGLFNNGNTALTFKTTRGAGGREVWQAVTLRGLSTAAWGIIGMSGTVLSS